MGPVGVVGMARSRKSRKLTSSRCDALRPRYLDRVATAPRSPPRAPRPLRRRGWCLEWDPRKKDGRLHRVTSAGSKRDSQCAKYPQGVFLLIQPEERIAPASTSSRPADLEDATVLGHRPIGFTRQRGTVMQETGYLESLHEYLPRWKSLMGDYAVHGRLQQPKSFCASNAAPEAVEKAVV